MKTQIFDKIIKNFGDDKAPKARRCQGRSAAAGRGGLSHGANSEGLESHESKEYSGEIEPPRAIGGETT